jgi:ABC-2 type transport system permease protein
MRHALRLTAALIVMVLKRRLAYRGDLLVQSLDELLRGLLAFVMLQVYISGYGSIAGWSGPELTFILGFSLVPISLFHAFCGNLYQLSGRYILSGELDRILLRPLPSFLQICLDRIAIEDLSGVLLGSGLMAWALAHGAGDGLGVGGALLLVLMLASAFVIVMSVFMAFAATGFWIEDRVGMVPPVYNLMEFGRWPTAIYHPALQILITCGIPFAFAAFYPASVFLPGPERSGVHLLGWLTPLVAVVTLGLATLVWWAGLRRYGSTGS